MSWIKDHAKTILGAACGAGSVALGVLVSPAAGIALGSVCGAAFGAHSVALGKRLAELTKPIYDELKKK